jgi:hypothetical protein
MRRILRYSCPLTFATTDCATPDNIQIDATPAEPAYGYPWDDEFYGPALIFGGGGRR